MWNTKVKKKICVLILMLMLTFLGGCNRKNQESDNSQKALLEQEDIGSRKDMEETNASDFVKDKNSEYEDSEKDNTSVVFESKLGYSIMFDSTVFTLLEMDDFDNFTYNLSEKQDTQLYLSVQKYVDMDVQALAEGVILQAGMDGVEVQDTYFGADGLKVKNICIEKDVYGVKQIQAFYVIPVEDGSLLLEVCSYVGISENIDEKFNEMLATFKLK